VTGTTDNGGILKLSRPRITFSTLLFGVVQMITALGVWAAATGGQAFRYFALGSIGAGITAAMVVALEAGLMAMIIFEPFRGLLRRMQYLFVPYSSTEPIHLLTPFLACLGFLALLQRQKLAMFAASPLALQVTLLSAIYFIQIFNPLQGGLFIGVTGALFFLAPVIWFYFGQAVDPNFVPRVLRVVVVLGLIASAWGLNQTVFGYLSFEQYWIDNTDLYSSIAVGAIMRAVATFNNAEEWGRYVQFGAVIAFGLAAIPAEGKKRIFWGAAGLLLVVGIVLSGQRSAVFGLVVGVSVIFLSGAVSIRAAVLRLCLLAVPVTVFAAVSMMLGSNYAVESSSDQGVSTMVSHTTQGTVKPTGEGSLAVRMETWQRVVTKDIPSNPLGAGIGADGLAAARKANNTDDPTDNHILSVAISAGLPAALLLIWILFRSLRLSARLVGKTRSTPAELGMWRIALALVACFLLNNIFGTTFTIYSTAPLAWLILGWISISSVTDDQRTAKGESDAGEIIEFSR
jgi:hypothetical protein